MNSRWFYNVQLAEMFEKVVECLGVFLDFQTYITIRGEKMFNLCVLNEANLSSTRLIRPDHPVGKTVPESEK